MKGRIHCSTGSWYTVKTSENKEIACRIKGKFRLDELNTTNPIAVGDWVDITMEEGLDTGMITHIHPRDNYIIRQSPHKRFTKHIIAANLDQAILIVTFSKPSTSLGFVDRFLLTTQMYDIPTILLFNKQDIYTKKDLQKYENAKAIYEPIGYKTLLSSAETGHNMEQLAELMKNKTSLVAGHSGVGKSTVLNYLQPELEIATKVISRYSKKGQHTTTLATMYDLPFGGQIIDTPGIKNFGIVHLEPAEVAHYFREMQAHIPNCKFSNCLHVNEHKCAVHDAIAEGQISEARFKSYLSILADVESENYWERGY